MHSDVKRVLLLLIALSTGCASGDAAKRITAFSAAAVVTTQNTTAAFDIVERKYYDAMVARVVVNYKPPSGFDPDKIKPFLSPEDSRARVEVLAGVKAYATKLAAIMGDDQLKQFDKQTIALSNSLLSLDKTVVANHYLKSDVVTPQEVAIFTTAVNALGRWIIELRRERDVRNSITEMDPHIQAITDLLAKDLGTSPADGGGARGLRGQLWNEYRLAMQEQAAFIDQGMLGSPALDPVSRRAEIQRLVALVVEQQQADATLKSMQGALVQLRDTHGKLKEAFDKHAFALESAISSLIAEGQRVKEFYDKLDKK